MASTKEFIEYVLDQLCEAGSIQCKKLFGEYGLWMDGLFFGTIEDDVFYVKVTDFGHRLLPGAEPVAPHGGKPGMYEVEDLEDRAFLKKLVAGTCLELSRKTRQ